MATLQESAQSILNEKNLKVLPENIVAGVTMFGVEGKAEINKPSSYYTYDYNMEVDTDNLIGQQTVLTRHSVSEEAVLGDFIYFTQMIINTGKGTALGKIVIADDYDLYVEFINFTPEGIDTSDATASAGDILMGQTAYVNGQLIEGEMTDLGVAHSLANNFNNDDEMLLVIEGTANDSGYVTGGQTTLSIDTNKIALAEVVGLTSDKIKKGEVILGIEGTCETGSSVLEYNSYDEMNIDTAQTESTKAIVGDSVYQATASENEGETMWVAPSVYTDATVAYNTLSVIGLEENPTEYEGMGATEEAITITMNTILGSKEGE